MVEHVRHHRVPSQVNLPASEETGLGVHTEDIMDGMEKVQAVAALVESVIIWRAQHIAWNIDIYKAEPLLFRLIHREGSLNPQAMDLLARIYFQQSKYEKAKDLWNRALELQPGNPGLRKTAFAMNTIAKSPTGAVFRHRLGVLFHSALMIVALCLAGVLGTFAYEKVLEFAEGPIAVQNLTGRFHYAYDSVTKDMVYIPAQATVESMPEEVVPVIEPEAQGGEHDGTFNVGFTRRKVASGANIGRIEVVVERKGNTLKATGTIPNLHVRYLVEQALWEVPGIEEIDIRGLQVDHTYRVNRGDSLWIIAKRIYGEGSAWTLLAKANDLRDPNKLSIGQELSLPLGGEELVLEE